MCSKSYVNSSLTASNHDSNIPEGYDTNKQECDELVDEDDSSQQGDTPAPTKKRARLNRTVAKNQKKSVPDKQGRLEGLMKMPIEIFTEIAYFLAPGDLICLARSNKFLRKILFHRSSIKIWRQAESNVPGLPCCPAGMCAPQYAALLFSKHCTLCGKSTATKVDVYISARLCVSCRDTELQELNPKLDDCPSAVIGLVNYTKSQRPKKEDTESRGLRNSVFALRREIGEVVNIRAEFNRTRDRKRLAEWEATMRGVIVLRRKLADHLLDYLEQIEDSREEELQSIKQNRRKMQVITERLKELGWTDEDMAFGNPDYSIVSKEEKSWRALVDVPKPLTDRIWSNLLPKLTQALEENRERNNIRKAKQRRIERRARVDRFLIDMKYKAHPFAPILDALEVGVPPPPGLGAVQGYQFWSPAETLRMNNPFPKTRTALGWDCLIDLSEVDMSMGEVEAKLEERRAQIEEKVEEWRTMVERRLVERFESSTTTVGDDVVLLVKGSTDSTAHLPRNTRLLLRADTLLKCTSPTFGADSWISASNSLCYYPTFVGSGRDILTEKVDYSSDEGYSSDEDEQLEENLDRITRDFEAENLVKRLLRELGMPDVAHVELDVMGRKFLCGRCTDGYPTTWTEIVDHYIQALRYWNDGKNTESAYHLRHPVAFRNVHDLDDSEPLIRKAPGELRLHGHRKQRLSMCYLCEGTRRFLNRLCKSNMLTHLQDVHNVKEPVEGIHYGGQQHKKWDAYHDAQSAVAGTSVLVVTSAES